MAATRPIPGKWPLASFCDLHAGTIAVSNTKGTHFVPVTKDRRTKLTRAVTMSRMIASHATSFFMHHWVVSYRIRTYVPKYSLTTGHSLIASSLSRCWPF